MSLVPQLTLVPLIRSLNGFCELYKKKKYTAQRRILIIVLWYLNIMFLPMTGDLLYI